jgi:uncharacterized protein (TIGR02757 family)
MNKHFCLKSGWGMSRIPPEIVQLLNSKVHQYKQVSFIKDDPICVPHSFSTSENIEISGFLTALISWGNRKSIIASAFHWMKLMNNNPFEYVMNYSNTDNKRLRTFYYRTFQPDDVVFIIKALNHFYKQHKSLEEIFSGKSIEEGIVLLRETLLSIPHKKRSEKHLPDIKKGSGAKRINMFMRWMIRKDEVDFGIWKNIKTSDLMIPLDVHTSRTAYELGLLNNTKSEWKNVIYLTELLKELDNNDPVKYDFALFGISKYESEK